MKTFTNTEYGIDKSMKKITARYFEADKEAGLRAGWAMQREGDKFPAMFGGDGRAHLSKSATDAELAEECEVEFGSAKGLEVIR